MMKFQKNIEFLFFIFLCVFTSSLIILPLGSFSYLKQIFFIIVLLFYIINKYSFHRISIIYLFLFIFVIIFSLFITFFNNFFEIEIITELKSMILFGLILIIFFDIAKRFTLKKLEILLKVVFISHFIYIIIKLIIFYLVFVNVIDFDFLRNISNDFVLAFFGNIPRISISNDLFTFIVFSLLYINKNILNRYLRTVLYSFMLLNILISFNRITILFVAIFILLYNIFYFNKKDVIKLVIIISTFTIFFFVSYEKNIFIQGIINTLQNRFTGEGSLSNQEKIYQYILIFKNMDCKTFLFGKGIGQFLENYIRRDIEGFRYGYEAFFGILVYQFGIVGLFILYILIIKNFLKKATFFSKKLLLHFLIANFWIFHGFVNPVILTSNSAVFLGIIYLSFFYNYRIHYSIRGF